MTTYNGTALSDSVIAYQKGITLQQGRALRDNPIAMFEGASGAPRLQFSALDAGFSTAGGVGSYVFAKGAADAAFGATVAGSTLFPTSAAYSVAVSSGTAATFNLGSALSGTWRCMGTFDLSANYGGGGSNLGATLWLRIA